MIARLLKNSCCRPLVIFVSTLLIVVNLTLWVPAAWAWDSGDSWTNVTHPTHSYLTECGIDRLKSQPSELKQFRKQIVQGANTELHELPVSGTKYGVDLNAKRIQHKGTNEGSDDTQGWWQDSLTAYRQGNKEQAYFYLGVLLHMIEDMGVPAHANKVYHQGNPREYDYMEYMALWNWRPSFNNIKRQDPEFSEPWKYYAFSQEWTHSDAPDYKDRTSLTRFWIRANKEYRELLSNREGRTCELVMWTLNSATKAFHS
jgi:hypothetical protein